MKKIIQLLSVLSLTVVFGVVAANAQSTVKLSADIPFDFSVGEKSFQAGTYDIRLARNNSGGATVTVIDGQGEPVGTVLGQLNGSSTRGKSQLVFERAGTRRVLTEIVSSNSGISIPVHRRQKRSSVTIGSVVREIVPIATVN